MSFDWYEAERLRYEAEEGMEEFLKESLESISRDNAKAYLGRYGDATSFGQNIYTFSIHLSGGSTKKKVVS